MRNANLNDLLTPIFRDTLSFCYDGVITGKEHTFYSWFYPCHLPVQYQTWICNVYVGNSESRDVDRVVARLPKLPNQGPGHRYGTFYAADPRFMDKLMSNLRKVTSE